MARPGRPKPKTLHVLKKLGPLGASSLLEHGEGGDFRGEGTKLRESHFRVWKLCGTDLRVLERCGIGFTVLKPEKRIHTFFKKKKYFAFFLRFLRITRDKRYMTSKRGVASVDSPNSPILAACNPGSVGMAWRGHCRALGIAWNDGQF